MSVVTLTQQMHACSSVVDSVNFREVEVGCTSTRVVNLYNASAVPAEYRVCVPYKDGAVFKVSHVMCVMCHVS